MQCALCSRVPACGRAPLTAAFGAWFDWSSRGSRGHQGPRAAVLRPCLRCTAPDIACMYASYHQQDTEHGTVAVQVAPTLSTH
jgi:hypothetical protein